MELLEDERPDAGGLPEPEPRYQTAVLPVKRSEHGQSLVRIAVMIVVGIIIVFLIVLLARWIYHAAHNSAALTTTTPNVSAPTHSGADQQQPANPGSGAAPTASPNNGSSSTSSNQNKLPNNGPGNVIGLFVGTSLAAAGLHYIINVRRFAKS